ncbi:MAG: B12-binding domain-containing radical SAM protein [Magnetococcales bacterium]|nr:B12-binding domain-containing radical SAM protein [Magnetococcales bacterium]
MYCHRIILVNPPPDYDPHLFTRFRPGQGTQWPIGPLLLGTCLKRAGFEVRIIDGQVVDCAAELQRELALDRLLWVGFSVMSSQFQQARDLSRLVRRLAPGLPVVWGGFHPTLFPESCLENDFIDHVVRGEADRAIVQLGRALQDGSPLEQVGNLAFRHREGVMLNPLLPLSDMADMPRPDETLLDDYRVYFSRQDVLGRPARGTILLTGMGCNLKCSFCRNAILREKHRRLEAEAIYSEMVRLHAAHGVDEFGLVDENFFADRPRLWRFLELLEQSPVRFRWSTNLRANYVRDGYLDRDFLARIAASGGYYFSVGAESGDPAILKKIRKGIRVEHLRNLARWTRGLDIIITYSFMAAIPGESCDMTLRTFRLIRELQAIDPQSRIIGPQVFRPYPGSPLFQEAVTMGLQVPRDWNNAEDFFRTLFQFRQISPQAIPWHPEPERFKYMLLSFSILLFRMNTPLRRLLLGPLHLLSTLRLNSGFYRWFFEKWLLDAINARLT